MAITTLDGAYAGMQPPRDLLKVATPTLVAGRAASLFYLSGLPGAAVAPTPGIGGAVLTSYAGQLPFTNPVSGNTYLSRLFGHASIAGSLWLCDRLWHNSGIDITSAVEQVFTASADIPARDMNGAALGDGVFGAIEVSAAVGAGTPTLTLKYTNQAGTADKTGTNILATAASAAIGAFYIIGLAAGDTGVRKAQSLTLSATWTSGTIHAVLFRVIAKLELPLAQVGNAIDALSAGATRLYDNSVPFFLFLPSTTTASVVGGHVIWSQG